MTDSDFGVLRFRQSVFDWRRPYVVGVVNVTPDSFSDGGRYHGVDAAVLRGRELIAAGADALDIGGESTRPGASRVSVEDELERVVPVVEGLAGGGVPLSVDTVKSRVAAAAVAAGAEIVNDVSGGLFDAQVPAVAEEAGAAYICGHVRGTTLAEVHAAAPPTFADVVAELRERLEALPGGLRSRTVIDPCLGFGKGVAENLELSAKAGLLARELGRPVLIGPSRKRFLGELTGRDVDDRDAATIGACLAAAAGGAHLLRVHNVADLVPALRVFWAIEEAA